MEKWRKTTDPSCVLPSLCGLVNPHFMPPMFLQPLLKMILEAPPPPTMTGPSYAVIFWLWLIIRSNKHLSRWISLQLDVRWLGHSDCLTYFIICHFIKIRGVAIGLVFREGGMRCVPPLSMNEINIIKAMDWGGVDGGVLSSSCLLFSSSINVPVCFYFFKYFF